MSYVQHTHPATKPAPADAPQNLSISEMELALRWKKSTRTIFRWRTQKGKLKGFKAGKATRYLLSEVEAFERGEQPLKNTQA